MKKQTLFTLLLAMSSVISIPIAYANVRLNIPEDFPGYPFYARISHWDIYHTEEWAAIAFYRDPACAPADFNLLDFFHIPAAFGCPLTVDGFEVWKNGPPPLDFAPLQVETRGLGAVPVWFVSWPELEAAIADDLLTITELSSMSSLRIGSATFFQETLHPPDPVDPTTGGAKVGHITIKATGTLEDGTSFRFGAEGKLLFPSILIHHVDIQFR